ncbi:YjeF N-terminal domain-containing protein [Piptocephalis cylindrospora]|uniref:Enhancer of mRNA-decapping protein 3 n=1 Tax=Piptocephalis cylindrospora TaxID=1907219 RepID=A0A4P9Y450_9FUNG|nr:YjeF N-terminal domain-containing protein [Piptocephalis cylindrospora]|eukprot:RKP12610.1 YjeF N-terminal domain-containing protein [Piptocephalis cylindrospora]
MSQGFIGLRVAVTLSSGLSLSGVILSVDPTTRELALSDVTVEGDPPQQFSSYCIAGHLVQDVRILPVSTSPSVADSSASVAPSPLSAGEGKRVMGEGTLINPWVEQGIKVNVSSFTNTSSSSPSIQPIRGRKQKKKGKGRGRPEGSVNEWADDDVREYSGRDFDFAGNLARFDKQAIFADFKEQDQISPSDRLVGHNRKGGGGGGGGGEDLQRKLHHTEMVLEDEHSQSMIMKVVPSGNEIGGGGGEEEEEGEEEGEGAEEEEEEEGTLGTGRDFPIISSRDVTHVSTLQMLEMEKLAVSEGNLSLDILVENAGRGIAHIIFSLLARSSSSPSSHGPKGVILVVGDHMGGWATVAAARHLLNRSIPHVHVCLAHEEDHSSTHSSTFHGLLRAYSTGGGHFLNHLRDSQHTTGQEILIDALLAPHHHLADLPSSKAEQTVLGHLRAIASFPTILSIDAPSSALDLTGTSKADPSLQVQPGGIISLGAPRLLIQALLADGLLHRVWVVDMGLPGSLWRRAGVRIWNQSAWPQGSWVIQMISGSEEDV